MQEQLVKYFSDFSSKYQCGFRQFYGTQNCLLAVIEKLRKIRDKKSIFVAVLGQFPPRKITTQIIALRIIAAWMIAPRTIDPRITAPEESCPAENCSLTIKFTPKIPTPNSPQRVLRVN